MKTAQQGTTLIETLVAAMLFVIVLSAFMGLFTSAFRYQQENMAIAYALNSASYISEYVSRALRMARKDVTGDCTNQSNTNFDASPDSQITFLKTENDEDICQQFFLTDDQIKLKKSDDETSNKLKPAAGAALSPFDLIIDNLKFNVTGDGQANALQPIVTFVFRLSSPKDEFEPMIIQTTISQRDLDVAY